MQDSTRPGPRPGQPSRPRKPKRTRELHAFGRAIRELRARRDLSQEELGFCSGLHRNYVGAIERGEINPTFRVLLKLSSGLDMPLSEIVQKYEHHRGPMELYSPTPHARPLGPARTHDR